MRRIIIIVLVLLLCGCVKTKSSVDVVKEYLDKYKNLNESVTKDIDKVIDENEEFNDAHKALYKKILLDQYTSLKYTVLSEEYDSNKALIRVSITVKDLNKAEEKAIDYLSKNLKDFYDENNIFDKEKYISKKLDLMNEEKDTIDYEITFYLNYKDKKWILNQPTDEDLEKIHGIYKG